MSFVSKRYLSIVKCLLTLAPGLVLTPLAVLADSLDEPTSFEIDAQALDTALIEFSEQADIQLVVRGELVADLKSDGLRGEFTPRRALAVLLGDTGLTYTAIGEDSVAVATDQGGDSDSKNSSPAPILMAQSTSNQAQMTASSRSELDNDDDQGNKESDDTVLKIPEILVIGKQRNVDIQRTENDSQPYVTFDNETIERSAATSLDDFLRRELSQNSRVDASNLGGGDPILGDIRSNINLRGIGTDQTLILVNGRRATGVSVNSFVGYDFRQADISGIPLSSIERIEVLPATASAIYGGGATGGVINIILKSDYRGFGLSYTYDNTFDSDSSVNRIEGSGGISFEGGRTDVSFAFGYSSGNELLARDRNFSDRSRELQLRANPDYYLTASKPPLGQLPNISSNPVFDLNHFLSTGEIRFNSPDLVLDDGTELNAPNTFIPEGYEGVSSDGGMALVGNAGLYDLRINQTSRTRNGGGGRALYAAPETQYLSASLRREMTDWLDLYVDASYSSNEGMVPSIVLSGSTAFIPAESPNNPFQQDINVTYPAIFPGLDNTSKSETTSIVAGGIIRLPQDWSLNIDLNRTVSEFERDRITGLISFELFDAFGDGTVDVMRDTNLYPPDISDRIIDAATIDRGETTLSATSARVAGPLFEISGGPIMFTGLLEARREEIADIVRTELVPFTDETAFFFEPEQSQDVLSVYAEALIPFVSETNARSFVELLELQLAVRHDSYDVEVLADRSQRPQIADPTDRPSVATTTSSFSSTDYTIAGRYSPFGGLVFRSSFSTGFLPPALPELISERELNGQTFLRDPRRGDMLEVVTIPEGISFGNPNLEPENSESFSFGLIYEPSFVDRLRVSVDYVSIEKTDEIASIDEQELLDRESAFSSRIVRGPLEDDAPPNFTGGPILVLDDSLINVAESKYKFIDYNIDYTIPTSSAGTFRIDLIAAQTLESASKILQEDDFVDAVGFLDAPREWRVNAGLNWELNELSVDWTAIYTDSVAIVATTTPEGFAEQQLLNNDNVDKYESTIVHDLQIAYHISERFYPNSRGNTKLRVGVRNIFNEQPPIFSEFNSGGTLGAFYNGVDPRLRSYYLTLSHEF